MDTYVRERSFPSLSCIGESYFLPYREKVEKVRSGIVPEKIFLRSRDLVWYIELPLVP
jgi:hypothetical protein